MPAAKGERPRAEDHFCVNCQKRLGPHYETEWKRCGTAGEIWSERWYTGKIHGYGVGGLFCTNVCAIRFGLRAARSGVQLPLDVQRRRVWRSPVEQVDGD